MAGRSQSGNTSSPDMCELYDATLGRALGVFPRDRANELKSTGPAGHELHVRKVKDSDASP